MRITRRQLSELIREAMDLDLEVGDVILTGKFKNKRSVVKDFGKDDLGQPTINGMKALNFRIEKLMPKDKWSKESKEALEFADEVNEMKITKRQLRRIIREAVQGPASSLYNEDPPYVLERSGVGWNEKFLVGIKRGFRGDELAEWGSLERAQRFDSESAAEGYQRIIDDLEGFYTRIQPMNTFEE